MQPEVDGTAQTIAMAGETGLSATELAAVLEQLSSGVVVVDREGRPVLTNQAARLLLEGFVGPDRSLIDIAVAAGMRTLVTARPTSSSPGPLARALRGETVCGEDYDLARNRDEQPLRLRVSGIPLRNGQGATTGALSVFTDVSSESGPGKPTVQFFDVQRRARSETERALARLQRELTDRRRAEEALLNSQQRLRLALEASHMGTWDYDVAEDRVEWSAEMATITGSAPEQTRVPLVAGLLHVHPDDRAAVERAIGEALDHGQRLQFETRIEHGATRRLRWLLIKGRVYRDEQGRALRMTGIALDITERKETEAARHALAHGERLRALGEMASGIAHDLNQSLALITGYSDMVRQELSKGVPEIDRLREMIDITARAALEGGKAVRGLLSFVRTQDLMAKNERIDVAEALKDIARLTSPRWRDNSQAEGRPINLEVMAEPDLWINGSPAELREAITNLIFNAVDALPNGGVIRLRASRAGEHVNLDVSDTGTGMPPEVQARVFDSFFTTKGEQGTGLGLPKVLAIVEKHGGTIELDSVPEHGTTFHLKFLRASAPASPSPAEPAEKAGGPPQRGIRVLVVEDEEQLARMSRLVLSQHGHRVVVAASGDEALERLQTEPFDLVISDLGLGSGKNGWDVAHEVRQRWPATRVVLVTGWGAAIDLKDAQARGVHQVIAKPYRIADLRQVADEVADGLARG